MPIPLPEVASEESSPSWHPRPSLAQRATHLLVVLSMLALLVGWHVTWPDLDRDFYHLHGWEHCQDAHLGRTIAEEGLAQLGFAPVVVKFFDAGAHYFYYTHYPPLTHAAIALLFRFTPAAHAHRTLRLAGMGVTLLFLGGFYLLARQLYGPDFAAWALFFGSVNAETFFFGAFPSMQSFAILFAVCAYWAYLRWRQRGALPAAAVCVLALVGGYLSTFFFYLASLPIAVDLLWCYPGRTRRHTLMAVGVLILPILFFLALQVHYRYGVALITGKEVYATGTAQNLAQRTHYELLLSVDLYQRVLAALLWYISPPAIIGAFAYYASRLSLLLPHVSGRSRARRWKDIFIILTLALGSCVLLFPQNTLDHQLIYQLAVLPLSLAGAAAIYRLKSRLIKLGLAGIAVVAAFSQSKAFTGMNNSPPWEFKTGVALSLFTPDGAFVRTTLEPNYYFMLLYYAHRNLLFRVPEQFRAVDVPVRFDLVFGAPAAAGACALSVPGTDAVIVDQAPALRPKLFPIHASYGNGAYEVIGARVTASYENMHLVEISWRQNRAIAGSVAVEIGQSMNGEFVRIDRFTPRGSCADTSEATGAPAHRDVYLVETSSSGPLVMRLFDPQTGRAFHDDAGRVDIALAE